MLPVRAASLPAIALVAGAMAQAPPGPLLARLPDAALIAVECAAPGAWLLQAEQSLGPLPSTLPDSARLRLAGGLLGLRAVLRMAPSEALRVLGERGMVLGLLPATPRPTVVACLRPPDAAAAIAVLQRLPDLHWERAADELLVSSTAAGLQVLRTAPAGGRWSRIDAPALRPGELRAHVDLAGLRPLVPWLQPAAAARLDGAGRFLFGAAAAAVTQAERATLSLTAAATGFAVTAALPLPAGSTAPLPLPPTVGGERTVPVAPAAALATLTLDRSLRAVLAAPDACFGPTAATAVRAFVSVADQIDGNASSFVDDVLGAVREPLTVLVLPPAPPDDGPAPRLLLPGICVVAPLASAAGERHLVRTAATLALIANIERGRVGKAPFHVRRLHDDAITGLVAEPGTWRGPGAPPLEHALSPCLLFGHGHVALATTVAAATAVLAQIGNGSRRRVRGDLLELHGPALAAAWQANAGPLTLARRLDEGETAAQARDFGAALQAVLGMFATIAVQLAVDGGTLTLAVHTRRP